MTHSSPAVLLWLFHKLRPLWLREKLFYRINGRLLHLGANAFQRAPLALAPGTFLRLEPGDVSHELIAGTGVYEADVSGRIARLARQGGLLVDVGANYGYYTAIWASANPLNRVVAFEASPANVKALRTNVELNGFGHRVEISELAVGHDSGTVFFQLSPPGQTAQGGLAPNGMETALQVKMTTIGKYFSAASTCIDVLKIDVEGADTWVIEGAERLLSEHRIRHIFFEHFAARMEYLGISQSRASELLTKYGYQVSALSPTEFYAQAPI